MGERRGNCRLYSFASKLYHTNNCTETETEARRDISKRRQLPTFACGSMSNQDGQTAVELRQPSSASGGAAGAAASDDAVASKHQYVEKAALIEVLRGGNMRLLKPEFILERHRRGL